MSPAPIISSSAWKSPQPSPKPRAWLVVRPLASPIRRLLMKCPHSWAMIVLSSALLRSALLPCMRNTTPPAVSAGRSACATMMAGMATLEPNMPAAIAAGALATLFTITTPTAPACCAFSTFAENSQVPRSMRAILPLRLAELVSATQPSVGSATTTSAVRSNASGPNCAPAGG